MCALGRLCFATWKALCKQTLWYCIIVLIILGKFHDDVIKWNIPLTKASDAELWCFLWSVPEQTVYQAIDTPVIWDAIAPLWRHCNTTFKKKASRDHFQCGIGRFIAKPRKARTPRTNYNTDRSYISIHHIDLCNVYLHIYIHIVII